MKILITLHPDRDKCGALTLIADSGATLLGPLPVAARASNRAAAARGNPSRSPLQAYGDPPLGRYRMIRVIKTRGTNIYPHQEFGPHGVIVLHPCDGEAAIAEANGRFHFFIQGGAAGKQGRLKATSGGFRLTNRHLRELLTLLAEQNGLSCECIEDAGIGSMGLVDPDPNELLDDPPVLAAWPQTATASRRNVLAGIGAFSGTMAVSLSGMFIGLQPAALALAQGAYPSTGTAPSGGASSSAPPGAFLNSTQTGAPPDYSNFPPGSFLPQDQSNAPPGSFLNSTQQSNPPDYSNAPPGTFLDGK